MQPLAPGTQLTLRVIALRDDVVVFVNEEQYGSVRYLVQRDSVPKARVGEEYEIEVRNLRPTAN